VRSLLSELNDLQALIKAAAAAPPETRIEFRDRIAAFGVDAVAAIEPWLRDDRLGAFAVRVVERAASYAANLEAVQALNGVATGTASERVMQDAAAALDRLRPNRRSPTATRRTTSTHARAGTRSPDDLVVGRTYKRRELHRDGYGGNWQSGISYPAAGDYVMLFSDPDAGREHGYNDRWSGDQYLYFGQWTGTGDMVFEVGNRAILDRSGNLHLFVAVPGDRHRYEGRFRLVRHESARTTRDGREFTAIVFVLEPIPES
jgi:hypothetical protein